jgi:hypothetical protein
VGFDVWCRHDNSPSIFSLSIIIVGNIHNDGLAERIGEAAVSVTAG